ncbi:MAG: PAS domain S-box protein, partial [Acidobacteriaceae bacterium]
MILSPLAVGCTAYFPAFRSIPWTLSYLVVAVVTEVSGVAPAIFAGVIEVCGVYRLVFIPRTHRFLDGDAIVQTVAFLVTGGIIIYLVHQRSRAIASLEASELHHRSVTETASDVVITIDGDSRILAINPSVRDVFGYKPEELVGQLMTVLMPERFRAAHLAGIRRYISTENENIPWTGVQLPGLRKDGTEVPLEISFATYVASEGRRFTGFIRDMSERHRSQAALLQSEKLAAVGRLASSIAHEINNPLESVTNLLYLSRETKDVGKIHDYVTAAEQELRRVSVIANQTLHFQRQSYAPSPARSDEMIAGSLALFQGKLLNAHIAAEVRNRAKRRAA